MAKGSGGTRASSSGSPKGLNTPEPANEPQQEFSRKLNPVISDYIDMVQSGKYYDLDGHEQLEVWNKVLDAEKIDKVSDRREIYSDAEWDAIQAFSGKLYEPINDYLVGKTKSISQDAKNVMTNLDKAFKRRKLTKDIIVYRGTYKAEKDAGTFKSTSLSIRTPDEFRSQSGNLHAYVIPKGTPFIYVTGKGEEEIILPRDFKLSKYRIK